MLLVIVVIVAMLYVVYWVLQNVYKINILEKGKELLGMNGSSQGSTTVSQSVLQPQETPDVPQYLTRVSPAPHADGAYNTTNGGVQMKNTLTDKSVSALLDLMANIK